MHIGIDLGGTKTEIICLHSDNGKELYRQRVPSPQGSYTDTVRNIASLVQNAEDALKQKGSVGIGIPGTVSSITGKVKNANMTWINGNPLDKDLEIALGRPVKVENDANCFAVSEATDGAAEGKRVVFGVIVGTGCGGGIVVDGKPLTGLNGIGGEWGHNPLPFPRLYTDNNAQHLTHFDAGHDVSKNISATYANKARPEYFSAEKAWQEFPGEQCYCGKRGCIETWISGTGFRKEYARVTGETLSTHDIIAQARLNEPKAADALTRYIDRLARCLAGVINVLDPDMIVLGGGMSNVQAIYDRIDTALSPYVFSDVCNTPVVPPRHGDSSGVRGAAWLWNKIPK